MVSDLVKEKFLNFSHASLSESSRNDVRASRHCGLVISIRMSRKEIRIHSLFFIRMLFLWPRLNILIFLPILG